MYTDDEAIVDSIEDLGLLFEIYRLADKVSKENIKKLSFSLLLAIGMRWNGSY
jgi:hypothetical protein